MKNKLCFKLLLALLFISQTNEFQLFLNKNYMIDVFEKEKDIQFEVLNDILTNLGVIGKVHINYQSLSMKTEDK
jgi:hypothetical protein